MLRQECSCPVDPQCLVDVGGSEWLSEPPRRHSVSNLVNRRHQHFDVYIGRPFKWGNPFRLGRDGDRDTVIAKYREYLLSRPDLLAALPELKGKFWAVGARQRHVRVMFWPSCARLIFLAAKVGCLPIHHD